MLKRLIPLPSHARRGREIMHAVCTILGTRKLDEIQLLPISFVTLLVCLPYKHTSVDLSSRLRYVPTLLIT
jgi:hypothetical protein